MILRLRCPKCKNTMSYEPRQDFHGKGKRCVYCGKSFSVAANITK